MVAWVSEYYGVKDLDLNGFDKHHPKNPWEVYNPDENTELVMPRVFLRHLKMMITTMDREDFLKKSGDLLQIFEKSYEYGLEP